VLGCVVRVGVFRGVGMCRCVLLSVCVGCVVRVGQCRCFRDTVRVRIRVRVRVM